VIPPPYPYSSRSRSKIRFDVSCCFAGRPLSFSRTRSMTPLNVQLRPRRRPASPVARWYRKRQHLRYRPLVEPKPARCLTSAQPLHIHRSSNLPVEFHAFHPPPSGLQTKAIYCRIFTPAQPVDPAAFSEGFSLLRLHVRQEVRDVTRMHLHSEREYPSHGIALCRDGRNRHKPQPARQYQKPTSAYPRCQSGIQMLLWVNSNIIVFASRSYLFP
jgi:hypothetical protein